MTTGPFWKTTTGAQQSPALLSPAWPGTSSTYPPHIYLNFTFKVISTPTHSARYLTDSQFSEFADLVRSMVLSTDISRQQEFLKLLKHFLDTGDCDMALQPRRHFILQIAIKVHL